MHGPARGFLFCKLTPLSLQGDEAALVDRTIQETPPQIGYSRDGAV